MPLRGFINEGIAGSFTSSCWGYWNHYRTLHGSSFWSSKADSMAHIPIATTGSLCLKYSVLTNGQLHILGQFI